MIAIDGKDPLKVWEAVRDSMQPKNLEFVLMTFSGEGEAGTWLAQVGHFKDPEEQEEEGQAPILESVYSFPAELAKEIAVAATEAADSPEDDELDPGTGEEVKEPQAVLTGL